VRGWVFLDSTAVITSSLDSLDSKLRGNPQGKVQIIDCHDSSLFDKSLESRNDGNPYWDKDFTDSRNDKSKINPQKYIKLAKIDSIRTDFVQAYLPQEATTSKINSTQKDLPQTTIDSMQVANNTNTQNNAFINNHRDISRYALNMTNDIDSMKSTESMQTDSTKIDSTKNSADFTQTKSIKTDFTKITAYSMQNDYTKIDSSQNDSIQTKTIQIDSMQMFFAQNAITSQQTDSTPQAFDKSSRYNKLKKLNDLESINLEAKDLGKVTATAEREFEAYQSGNQIGREMLDSNPSGNGDITSILKILPNVQFDNAQNRSTTPG
ncbi:hypothetical protein, partial [Helicobacter sp. T3_23-1059]